MRLLTVMLCVAALATLGAAQTAQSQTPAQQRGAALGAGKQPEICAAVKVGCGGGGGVTALCHTAAVALAGAKGRCCLQAPGYLAVWCGLHARPTAPGSFAGTNTCAHTLGMPPPPPRACHVSPPPPPPPRATPSSDAIARAGCLRPPEIHVCECWPEGWRPRLRGVPGVRWCRHKDVRQPQPAADMRHVCRQGRQRVPAGVGALLQRAQGCVERAAVASRGSAPVHRPSVCLHRAPCPTHPARWPRRMCLTALLCLPRCACPCA
jgi:hypothetical protein